MHASSKLTTDLQAVLVTFIEKLEQFSWMVGAETRAPRKRG